MATALPLAWQSYRLPKQGNTWNEIEDASAGDLQLGRFAVADGASESAFALEWANLLVDNYVRLPNPLSSWLPMARQSWLELLQNQEFLWYTQIKFDEGALATLLGVTFQEATEPDLLHWKAHAVGDSCLFLVRTQQLCQAFPRQKACEFSCYPRLLCSRQRPTWTVLEEPEGKLGDFQPGD